MVICFVSFSYVIRRYLKKFLTIDKREKTTKGNKYWLKVESALNIHEYIKKKE